MELQVHKVVPVISFSTPFIPSVRFTLVQNFPSAICDWELPISFITVIRKTLLPFTMTKNYPWALPLHPCSCTTGYQCFCELLTKLRAKTIEERDQTLMCAPETFKHFKRRERVQLSITRFSTSTEQSRLSTRRYTKEQGQKKRNRKRNIIWYNPPYSRHVTTKVEKRFSQLLDKHFPKGNILNKIFNRNNVKVSYSYMDNMANIISSHNKSLLSNVDRRTRECNCRIPADCPLEGRCQTKNIVCQATVTSQLGSYIYIGACDTEFKKRWYNHKSSFKLEHKRTDTELSKHIWTLRENNIDFDLNWKILKQANSYSHISKRCQLCLWEKFFIITERKSPILNSRTELISKQNKFELLQWTASHRISIRRRSLGAPDHIYMICDVQQEILTSCGRPLYRC
ncbi:hypothetical protein HOLleu_20112 [Holothuria leucospilota]|uniref:Uncharacterized protein n=1 Tax=Holothuria leucospilota TaxID=206669 RepID=A0A9Q1C1A9_HOLLE|nr:hypothetical protein HOLleu_20112 [Holothuria leucospilota]